MSVTAADLRDQLPAFDDIKPGLALEINGEPYEVTSVETERPGPGEEIRVLVLAGVDGEMKFSWGAGHDVEEVVFVPVDGNPMMDAIEVREVKTNT
ncbi:hypothetical protein [Halobaculum magnesiiphilum]|uniref:Translation elongation factor KOW-like domain-containing protein n=1 Tax=Halobaculum magnesiiphilum TaxID=1017351 RepID=A0A8T8WH64_9EURY|nr:hypothetical protein [Halobaculum magnesiiphilum]QZP39191.1 hypothetical protein K6T50_16145 [Halobaculum magnesiiphilum]